VEQDTAISPNLKVILTKNSLSRWSTSEEEVVFAMEQNPSLRGMVLGYVAELKLKDIFSKNSEVSSLCKYDDHDRNIKCDWIIVYKNHRFLVEVKSVQTNSVKKDGVSAFTGSVQVDASDKRMVSFDDGSALHTTLLLRNQFDILAVNCFPFTGKWDFMFCLNKNLPTSKNKNYSLYHQNNLIASSIKVSYPPLNPFTDDIFSLMDSIINHTPMKCQITVPTLQDFMA
jgi:hypothetical protein